MKALTLAPWSGEEGEGAAPFYMSTSLPRRLSAAAAWLVAVGAAAVLLVWSITWSRAESGELPLLGIAPLTATGFFGLSLVLLAGARSLGRGRQGAVAAGRSKAMGSAPPGPLPWASCAPPATSPG
jgi:hypothetical protein